MSQHSDSEAGVENPRHVPRVRQSIIAHFDLSGLGLDAIRRARAAPETVARSGPHGGLDRYPGLTEHPVRLLAG
jgi:hypothetical protein